MRNRIAFAAPLIDDYSEADEFGAVLTFSSADLTPARPVTPIAPRRLGLRFVNETNMQLMKCEDESEIVSCLARAVRELNYHAQTEVWLYDRGTRKLKSHLGTAFTSTPHVSVEAAFATGETRRGTFGKAGSEVHYICSPLSASRNIYGVCYMGSSQRAFSRDEQDMLTAISFHTGSVLQALHAKGEEERTCERMIHALTLTIDARDGMTAGHSGRVASYSQSIARYLGMSQKEQRLAYYAGLLHDYGKIGVRDDILCKPSQLTPEEYEQIKQHPEYTLSILSKLKFSDGLAEVPRIASLHHERPDGKGYPRGLRRGEIPLASLVIGVADFFDALTVKRHYRDPMPFEEVLSLMEAGRDTQFDGQVLDAFKRFFYKEFLPRKKRI